MKKSIFIILILSFSFTQNNYAQEQLIGEIRMFAGNFAPRGWSFCDGQILSIQQHQALFSIIGTTYGGDGRTTFALPDLRSRVAMHPGNGPGLRSRRLGEKGGSETNTLSVLQLPAHTHPITIDGKIRIPASDDVANADFAVGSVMAQGMNATKMYRSNATPGVYMGDPDMSQLKVNAGYAGGNQPVNNVQPFQCVNYIICMQGQFPSRN